LSFLSSFSNGHRFAPMGARWVWVMTSSAS
jgi:hypothetical protein